MNAAPPFDCAGCGRRIAKAAGHNITDDGRVICTRCALDKAEHHRLFPHCGTAWHDVFDHLRSVASTRAGVAAALGLWP